jgi:hypothetical protein
MKQLLVIVLYGNLGQGKLDFRILNPELNGGGDKRVGFKTYALPKAIPETLIKDAGLAGFDFLYSELLWITKRNEQDQNPLEAVQYVGLQIRAAELLGRFPPSKGPAMSAVRIRERVERFLAVEDQLNSVLSPVAPSYDPEERRFLPPVVLGKAGEPPDRSALSRGGAPPRFSSGCGLSATYMRRAFLPRGLSSSESSRAYAVGWALNANLRRKP